MSFVYIFLLVSRPMYSSAFLIYLLGCLLKHIKFIISKAT